MCSVLALILGGRCRERAFGEGRVVVGVVWLGGGEECYGVSMLVASGGLSIRCDSLGDLDGSEGQGVGGWGGAWGMGEKVVGRGWEGVCGLGNGW